MSKQLSQKIHCDDCKGLLFYIEMWNGQWFVVCKHCNTTMGVVKRE